MLMNAVETTPSRFALISRACLFWLCFAVTTIFWGVFVISCFALPISFRYAGHKGWAKSCVLLMKTICRLSYRVEGRDYVPAKPVIIFSKHQSAYETIALADIIMPLSLVLKRELLWIPIFGWALALVAPTAIDRKAGGRAIDQVVKQGCRSLNKERWVVIFPEGTRTAPGSPPNYRIGGAILAAKSGYPVLPIAHNAGEFWPRGSLLMWPGEVVFSIGPVIHTENKKPEMIMQQAQNWIETKMKEISDPRRWNR
ncbi:MAG TPA: lysophospholipid acyltransferase family protein [Gammaproteobacteria bacterium]|nr:lysophospholipid acyltransferase family protein [Gammaproteobacteria bacterium]